MCQLGYFITCSRQFSACFEKGGLMFHHVSCRHCDRAYQLRSALQHFDFRLGDSLLSLSNQQSEVAVLDVHRNLGRHSSRLCFCDLLVSPGDIDGLANLKQLCDRLDHREGNGRFILSKERKLGIPPEQLNLLSHQFVVVQIQECGLKLWEIVCLYSLAVIFRRIDSETRKILHGRCGSLRLSIVQRDEPDARSRILCPSLSDQ